MKRKNVLENAQLQKELLGKNRIATEDKWEEIKNSFSTEWLNFKQKRHENILKFGEFDISSNANEAEHQAQAKVKNIIDMPKQVINSIDSKYMYDDLNLAVLGAKQSDRMIALKNAQDSILMAQHVQRTNSAYEFNNQIGQNISSAYNAQIINPYEAQVLFETTSLGYQGIMIPIRDAFSTTISVISKYLSFYDVDNISKFMIEKNVIDTIKMAVIDCYVYGGGIITPVFKFHNQPQLLGDLKGNISKYFGADKFSLDTLMCFDRYCTIPTIHNDGLYSMRLWSSLPMHLTTIFEEGALNGDWYAKFSIETTSRSKFIRPDGFGISVFARANKAVYNYEQQIQFLNYALGQLSIVVFNSKSQDYMNGGSADHTWDSPIGGSQMQDIRAQLSAMQQSMNIERGLYLNDIEVTTLNRTFTGVDSIINAINLQASMAFGIKKDVLFGEVKSSLGYKENSNITPTIQQYREAFRSAILQVVKWCVVGYFAQNDWCRQLENGKKQAWDKTDFENMLNSLDLTYADSIKTNEDILKEAGVKDISKLVEQRLMKISGAINYLNNIPILNKAYDLHDKEYQEWADSVDKLQNVGIQADTMEQQAISAINEAIFKKRDPLSPPQDELLNEPEINNNLIYNRNNASGKPLEDFGEVDNNGIVNPVSVEKRKTRKEVTQKYSNIRSHI